MKELLVSLSVGAGVGNLARRVSRLTTETLEQS